MLTDDGDRTMSDLDGVARIVVDGDVDMGTVGRLRSVVETGCRAGARTVVIDLSAVEFIDSHGLHLVAETHRRLTREDRVLVVVPPADGVWRPFVLTGLDEILVVDPEA